MSDHKRTPALAAAALALCALAAGNVLGEQAYRERYPDAKIDPAKGVEGDVGFSDTIQYWRTEADLERNAGLADKPAEQWKLNWKHMDLDRIDLHLSLIHISEPTRPY